MCVDSAFRQSIKELDLVLKQYEVLLKAALKIQEQTQGFLIIAKLVALAHCRCA